MLSLKLFNAVLASSNQVGPAAPRVMDTLPLGYVIAPSAAHLADEIVAYYEAAYLDGGQLNQTFHKSWETVMTSSRGELLAQQLLHYLTTYGFERLGIETDYVYFPDEVSEVPEFRKTPVRVIHGLSADELAERCLGLLESGVALADETLDDLMGLLEDIDRVPTDLDRIKNREFAIRLTERHAVLPQDPVEFLRFLVYKATGETLLIKNDATINAIKRSSFNPVPWVEEFGYERAASVFLRFKPLWLAFKHESGETSESPFAVMQEAVSPANDRKAMVNRLSRLAKNHHRPLPEDYLNTVTSRERIDVGELTTALDRANNFRKIRLLYALNTRLTVGKFLMYRIRNGRSYTVEAPASKSYQQAWKAAYEVTFRHLAAGLDVAGKTFLMSPGVALALPATEKMFVGNLPVGTSVYVNDGLVVGIHWRNEWGAWDLDLSAFGLKKVGWNSHYNASGVTYSGDVTDATDGATELLRFGEKVDIPHLVNVNVYNGQSNSEFQVFAGKAAGISSNHMLAPDELLAQTRIGTDQRQQIIGLVVPDRRGNRFVFCNVGAGQKSVSGNVNAPRLALLRQFQDAPQLEDLLEAAGGRIVRDPAEDYDVDLRWEALAKDTVLSIFS